MTQGHIIRLAVAAMIVTAAGMVAPATAQERDQLKTQEQSRDQDKLQQQLKEKE